MVVDFPAPFGPRKPVTMPGWTVNVRSETAVVGAVALRQRAYLNHEHDAASGASRCRWGVQPAVGGDFPTCGAGQPDGDLPDAFVR